MSQGGNRNNAGKMRWDLVPMDAMEELVRVYTFGAQIYEPRNWEKGLSWMETYASLMRHLAAWQQGYDFDGGDPENPDPNHSGLLSMAHVAWNAMALLAFQLRGVGVDDRPITEDVSSQMNPDQIDPDFSEIDKMGRDVVSALAKVNLFDEMIREMQRDTTKEDSVLLVSEDTDTSGYAPDAEDIDERPSESRTGAPDGGEDIISKDDEAVESEKDPNE